VWWCIAEVVAAWSDDHWGSWTGSAASSLQVAAEWRFGARRRRLQTSLFRCESSTTSRVLISLSWAFETAWMAVIWSWWFGEWWIVRTQNKATTRQPSIFCGRSGRLPQSTTGHSFGTDIINVKKHAQDTSVLSFLLHWLTVSRARAANIVRRPCSDSSHVTAPYK